VSTRRNSHNAQVNTLGTLDLVRSNHEDRIAELPHRQTVCSTRVNTMRRILQLKTLQHLHNATQSTQRQKTQLNIYTGYNFHSATQPSTTDHNKPVKRDTAAHIALHQYTHANEISR